MKKNLFFILVLFLNTGCTQKKRASEYGGSMAVQLPCGDKLVNIMWKENNMWVLTRPFKREEEAETYTLKEDSNWGVAEGIITIKECKP